MLHKILLQRSSQNVNSQSLDMYRKKKVEVGLLSSECLLCLLAEQNLDATLFSAANFILHSQHIALPPRTTWLMKWGP